ncbi:microtubule-associated tumor suppressor candidate 2 homolog isoform X1 [Hippocampus zosterae]|uniref:microtubule-associated tumor suppressor candidate 2 homolog isoform X1 n=1 Tax=Hippocampus zosterae TaxID=109293 RepID=UPI00223D144A|nr:microtubule-associated tumor suppressor candidate 2 homolog isoform X1 [Hippocampus zosterae]XP_051934339.1 microtubule-associated tumor suppressor candidate 2 homolog isoform X1 [Hippocampus zosterae]XP_051934340.1 microtubule-associated tumor suppressor candidate 2 homolog isoform X1 [Hippocampus zosterae]
MCERAVPLRNDNVAKEAPADGNANDIGADDEAGSVGRSSGSDAVSECDKVVIWGTDSRCDDPELAEFEMLECQELEALLVEDGEDFVGLRERSKDQLPSSSRTATEPGTETHVDNQGRPLPSRTENGEKFLKSWVDLNLNSTEERPPEALERNGNNNQKNKATKRAADHKTPTVGNVPTDQNAQADESGSPRKMKVAQPKAVKNQGCFENSLKKQNSFERSFKKQLSFENYTKNSARNSFENVSRSSSLEGRKPWGSSSRPVPPASPRKQPPASPAKGQSARVPKTSLASAIPKPVGPLQKDYDTRRSASPPKPLNVRPKIITCIRKSPAGKLRGTDTPPEGTTHHSKQSSNSSTPAHADLKVGALPKGSPVLGSSVLDKYREDTSGHCSAGLKPGAGGATHEYIPGKCPHAHTSQDGASVYRSPRGARPQLGLGAVTRQPTAKTRVQQTGPKLSSAMLSQPGAHGSLETSGEQRRSGPETSPRNPLLKSGHSGLRPPGFSALPPVRVTTGGIMRSVSSMSNDGNTCRTTPTWRKETLKESEAASPKKCAVVSPKPQSPVRGRCGSSQEVDRALVKLLRERCEQQARQLRSLQAQLKKASLCMSVFSITTQHFCHKSESAAVREGELSLELARIRDEVAFSVSHWEQLQREKQELERRFEEELRVLRAEQRVQLGALEERLRARHSADTRGLRALQRAQLDDLKLQQREQMAEMNENHEASLVEMEATHNDTLATLREEHDRTVKNLKMAHEQQRKSLEEEFEKIRLSLQDQVDMLTFQNRSLRDRAKRFEEALRKSTDDQIVDALAPYKHIEEDLKSLKEVLEMKNQQIHQQDLKITELEKIQAEKNVHLEERVQVLQQQNEDLKERIDKNLAVSRQLSEENANLQVHVEKESTEKKRLSRTNEELLWRLQTGELSPRMSPSGSPVHRSPSLPGSPARPSSYHQ